MKPEPMVLERKRRILLAEDELNLRRVLSAHLRRHGYEVIEAWSVSTAREAWLNNAIDLVLTDLKMPDSEEDGINVLRFVVERAPKDGPRVPVLILTAHGTADKAIEALSLGAYNLISKPFDTKEVLTQVENAIREREEKLEAASREDVKAGRFGIIGKTPSMQALFETIATVADSPATVLVTGESGTGKELVAKALHERSSRAGKPFVAINCAAIPDNLLESELFGFEKGAFTGAVNAKPGRLEQADTGTLFLDEIGELRPELQVKLLRVIQEQSFERVGGVRSIEVDVRVVAATNRDLQAEVRAGRFREDLYYRLNVVPIWLPPLRERREDIPLLVEFFLKKYNRRLAKSVQGVDRTLLEALGRCHWPGNIRQLEHVIERMVLFSDSAMLGVRQLPSDILGLLREHEAARPQPPRGEAAVERQEPAVEKPLPAQISLKDYVREETSRLERDLIMQALAESGWNVTRTAERLGLSRKGLQVKMKELDIRKPGG